LSTLREAHRIAAAWLTIILRTDKKADKQEWVIIRQHACFDHHPASKSLSGIQSIVGSPFRGL